MKNTSSQVIVYILSSSQVENSALLQKLENTYELDMRKIELKHIERLNTLPHKYIVLVDAQLSRNELLSIKKQALFEKAFATALFNAPTAPNLLLLSQLNRFAGYFYQTDGLEKIVPSLISICHGHTHLPHDLLIAVFQFWQKEQMCNSKLVKIQLSLTKRETQILKHLQVDLSNLDLANHLGMTERTLKCHLYNIFKKIEVKNRRQAINWATLYLSNMPK